MWNSLSKIIKLPDDTKARREDGNDSPRIEVRQPLAFSHICSSEFRPRCALASQVFCAHEYTQSNARFALTVEPNNEALKARAAEVAALRDKGQPTVPSTLGVEKATNPFLRPDSADLQVGASWHFPPLLVCPE